MRSLIKVVRHLRAHRVKGRRILQPFVFRGAVERFRASKRNVRIADRRSDRSEGRDRAHLARLLQSGNCP